LQTNFNTILLTKRQPICIVVLKKNAQKLCSVTPVFIMSLRLYALETPRKYGGFGDKSRRDSWVEGQDILKYTEDVENALLIGLFFLIQSR
jgi:hypothetical protein